MKADELMVGDWVHYKMDLGKDGIYEKDIRINNIYGSEVNCELRSYEIISGKRSSNLYPIPLTPEILEKNGFHYNDLPFVQSWEQFGLSLHLGGNGYRINCGQNVAIVIDSVHQLQHALKLCGIDKEIVV